MKIRVHHVALTAALCALAAPAAAQEATAETITVSSTRLEEGGAPPHITLAKRADFLITRVRVVCDTRDLSQRREELKTTLRNLLRTAAQTPTMSLGLGDDIIGALNESNFDIIIVPDKRADTSQASVVINTALSPVDTFDAATGRIKAFIEKTPKAGRTEILREDNWDLTITGPEQYRDAIIGRIVADARHTADLFGQGHTITVEGTERRIAWYQRGPLDLALYIPYRLTIVPEKAR
jgi:hypothetical protein